MQFANGLEPQLTCHADHLDSLEPSASHSLACHPFSCLPSILSLAAHSSSPTASLTQFSHTQHLLDPPCLVILSPAAHSSSPAASLAQFSHTQHSLMGALVDLSCRLIGHSICLTQPFSCLLLAHPALHPLSSLMSPVPGPWLSPLPAVTQAAAHCLAPAHNSCHSHSFTAKC